MENFRKNLTHQALYESIEKTLQRMRGQKVSRSDLKIINSAIKELGYTFKIFASYRDKRKVTVFGSSRSISSDANFALARQFAKEIVRQGYMVVTGAGGGIMHAAQEGAGSAKSFGLNIRLPFEQMANPIIRGDTKLINFKYFFTRKLTMVKESDALVLFPGGFGTQDELFETLTLLQTGKSTPKPVICIEEKGGGYWKDWARFNLRLLTRQKLISEEDRHLICFTDNAESAVSHIINFYHNYHSIRYYDRWLLIRLKRLPSKRELRKITDRFRNILRSGTIHPSPTHLIYDPELKNLNLKTLKLKFTQNRFGILRKLIDTLNQY